MHKICKHFFLKYAYFLPYFIGVVSLAGCSNDIHNHPDLVSGKQLFEYHCSVCHKDTGKGNFLKGVPANKDTELSANQIVHRIKHKDNSGDKMPVFTNMSAEEAKLISDYLKTL